MSTTEKLFREIKKTKKNVFLVCRCLTTSCLVRVFQRVNDLPPTEELDEATLEVMRQPRCGMEDPFNKKFHKYRIMGELRTYCSILIA